MNLPIRLFKFWYPHAFETLTRAWLNTLMVIEEDLAVGLMFRLLFTPLFHDSSIVGKVLSFLFRSARIVVGLVAYALTSAVFLLISLIWFLTPILAFLPQFNLVFKVLFLFGISLFIERVRIYPEKRLSEIEDTKDISGIWDTTKLKSKNLTWDRLFNTTEVQLLIKSLELDTSKIAAQQLKVTDDLVKEALKLAKDTGAKYLTAVHFWVAYISRRPRLDTELMKVNLKFDDFMGALKYLEHKRDKWRVVFVWDEDFSVKHLKGINRGWLSAPTPALDSVSTDLTKVASQRGFEDFVGREKVVKEVVSLLSAKGAKNVLITGPAGSGRSALVDYLAKLIVAGNAPIALATKRLVSLDLDKLLSGVETEGDLAERVKNIFEEVRFVGDIIVFVDEIQNLGLGEASSHFNLLSLIGPHLESDEIQFLAITDDESYARILEKDATLTRVFNKVELPPANVEETVRIIQERAIELERYNRISVTYLAIDQIVTLAKDYLHDRVLPDSAISILDECQTQAEQSNRVINTSLVKEVFGRRVDIPIQDLGNIQKQELLNLEELIHQKMIDQVEAVSAVANTLRRAAVDIREKTRPIGSFLFVGPTGVGKTQLAKTLAEVYFRNKGAFIRFDMSEYQNEEAVERLIGGGDNPGELTEAIKNRPYSLILLDEFEKAEPKILTLFLQVLEDGRLTDARGVTVDFTNTIIIATSNAASLTVAQELQKGLSLESVKASVNAEILKVFKPELINRFDEVVIFKPLSQEDLQKIVLLKLQDLAAGMREQGYIVNFDQKLISTLAKRGFDPALGARPLRRLIQDTVESNLSKMILEGKLLKGENFQASSNLIS